MSWKGAARSFAAAARRAERAQQQHAREAARQFKQLQKEQAVVDAAQAVAAYNEYVSVITSIHRDCSATINWSVIQDEAPPVEPSLRQQHEQATQASLNSYQPSWLDKLLKRGPTKIRRLEEAVTTARQHDAQIYAEQQQQHIQKCQEWQDRQDLTREVLARNTDAYPQVFEAFTPFEGIDALGSHLEFTFTANHIEVDIYVNTAEVIPDFVVSQLASGKLSRKSLSISKFNELYQDYVCGCLLRVAREVQAHLPVSQVIVHALSNQLNSATGQMEDQVILSVAMPRTTLKQLNFTALDPSDAMCNFNHTMKFTKTGGFQVVDRVGLAAPLITSSKRR